MAGVEATGEERDVNVAMRRIATASFVGALLEWYDFYVYSFLSLYFAALFFTSGDRTSQLLSASGVFAAGFLVRPIGGWLFGRLADRRGRRFSMMASVLLILIFSANTAFADFPRVCRFIARDGYLPISFANRGRRLVYSEGICVLAVLTGALLIGFGGITDRLIPLFAVGAFLAFTMSQAGMVAHWKQKRVKGARSSMMINGIGAIATGLTVLIIIVAKFTEGAWITLFAIPSLIWLMRRVHRHYVTLQREIEIKAPIDTTSPLHPLFVVPLHGWTRIGRQALRFAMSLSSEIKVLHVYQEESDGNFQDEWATHVEEPAKRANLPTPELIEIKSPYRFVVTPIVEYVTKLANENPNCRIVTVIPELVEKRWYYYFLHNQRASLLKAQLLMEGNDRISVLNIPWYLKTS